MPEIPPPIRLHSAPAPALWTIAVAVVLLAWAYGTCRPVIRRCAVCLVAALLGTTTARASEVCHFAGTTDYSGRIGVTTDVNARVTDGTTTVDVIVRFMATPWPLVHIRYLMQEISTWKSDQMQECCDEYPLSRGWPYRAPNMGSVRARPGRTGSVSAARKDTQRLSAQISAVRPSLGSCELRSALGPGLSPGRCRAAARPRPASLVGGAGSSFPSGAGILLEQVDTAKWTSCDGVFAGVQEGQAPGPDHWRGGAAARWAAGLANVRSVPRPEFDPCIHRQGLGFDGPASVATRRLRAKWQLHGRRCDPAGGLPTGRHGRRMLRADRGSRSTLRSAVGRTASARAASGADRVHRPDQGTVRG